MRLPIAACSLLALQLLLNVTEAVLAPPRDLNRFNLRENASPAEKAFTKACEEERTQDILALLPSVRPAVAAAQYIDAFLANQPNVVRTLLENGVDANGADVNGVGQIFYHANAKSVDAELLQDGHHLGELFVVYKSEDQLKPVDTPDFERLGYWNDGHSAKHWRIASETQNIPLVFSYSGAIAVACTLWNPSMAAALFASPLLEDDHVNLCYMQAYEIYRSGLPGKIRFIERTSWTSDPQKDIFGALLATKRGHMENLITQILSKRKFDQFKLLLKEPRVDRSALAAGLGYILDDRRKNSYPEGDIDRKDESFADVAESILDADRSLMLDDRYSGPLIIKAAAARDRPLFELIAKRCGWYQFSSKERSDVLSEAARSLRDPKHRTVTRNVFDKRWFEWVVTHLNVPAKHVVAALNHELAQDSRQAAEKKSMKTLLAELRYVATEKTVSETGTDRDGNDASVIRASGKNRSRFLRKILPKSD